MVSDVNTSRSPETAAAAAAAAAASVGSIYPHLLAKFASHRMPDAAAAAAGPSVGDLRARLLIDTRSAFSCVRRSTSRDPVSYTHLTLPTILRV